MWCQLLVIIIVISQLLDQIRSRKKLQKVYIYTKKKKEKRKKKKEKRKKKKEKRKKKMR